MQPRTRRHKRYRVSLPMQMRWNGANHEATLENLSARGALVRTNVMPLLNSHIELTAVLPGSNERITTRGRVVHVVMPDHRGQFAIGLELAQGCSEHAAVWTEIVGYARRVKPPQPRINRGRTGHTPRPAKHRDDAEGAQLMSALRPALACR